jgi:uncharacterized protein (TIRG00374 family)
MSQQAGSVKQPVNLRRLVLPIAIGIGVSVYLIASSFNPAALSAVHLTRQLIFGLTLALLAVLVRDFAFMYKVRLSTGEKLSWLKTLQAIIMWEFGAAVTPKVSEVAFTLFVLKKSGISYGRSAAAILLNSFLDNLVFVVMFALLYGLLGKNMLSISSQCADLQGHAIMQTVRNIASYAWIGYAAFCVIALFFAVTLFILPHAARKFFHRLAQIKILHRVQGSLQHLGDEIEITANEYKNRETAFWLKMITATWINWTARYLLVNAILYAFSPAPLDMLQVFARQYVLWMFLAVPSTPGSSGVAEISFIALNCEFMPVGLSAAIALIWRMYSYYLFLVLGMIVLPGWSKNALAEKN